MVRSWKSYSGKLANKMLGSRGAFWQREYYNHLLRSEAEFARAIRYVGDNPEKAGLQAWAWVCGRDARTTAAEDSGATKSSA